MKKIRQGEIQHSVEFLADPRIRLAVLAVGLLAASAFPQRMPEKTASIHGIVFTWDADGTRAVVPGAAISLNGEVTRETKADDSGKFVFQMLPPGSYKLVARASGLIAIQTAQVGAGNAADVPLEMKVESVSEAATVTASASTQDSAAASTVGGSAVKTVPNVNERFESLLPLVPGVVRGSDGVINMKGARSSQNGALVNSADVTDPVTGATAINLPIDVVSSIQVLSTPFDPAYGKFTGAVANVETRTGNFNKLHVSAQNLFPRLRDRDGSIMGLEAVTPRVTFSGPILKDRIAFTQSFEYRFVRTPVNSLPPLQRDMKRESFDSYTQLDWNINQKQTATVSFALFPQKFDYLGLNTFTPLEATPNLHERGYQFYLQHRYVSGKGNLLSSQVSFRRFDADVTPNSSDSYRLLIETAQGGFFNRQHREATRTEWQEIFQSRPLKFYGSHELKTGINFAHSSYDGHQQFLPVNVIGVAGAPIERIEFGPTAVFAIDQDEVGWFVGDKWTLTPRLAFDLGLRFDRDSITDTINPAPRAGFVLALTGDGRTLLKGGAGLFYDRVPLNIAAFPILPGRKVTVFDGQAASSTAYRNQFVGELQSPRSEVWSLELERQILKNWLIRTSYQQRNTVHEFLLTPIPSAQTGVLSLTGDGRQFYREFQVTTRYQIHNSTLNASYVRSRAFGDLNDFNQFFGNDPLAVIEPNQRGRLPFDTPNRFIAWGEFAAPWKLTVTPVLDAHTGFPYSVVNQEREFVGPRNALRFPRFVSADLQVLREIRLPFPGKERHARIGVAVFDIFNHFNPRDVQNDLDSARFNEFFNGPGRTFRGKFVLEF